MILWTTVTILVHVRNANLVASGCHVRVTIMQGCTVVHVDDPPMSYDDETHTTTLTVGLSQRDSAGLHAGPAKVQVNALDWMGWRAASDQVTTMLGSNLYSEEMTNG